MAIRRKAARHPLCAGCSSRPELLGRGWPSSPPGLANWANRQPLLRVVMEATLGIHREKLLPDFHGETFDGLVPQAAGARGRRLARGLCSSPAS